MSLNNIRYKILYLVIVMTAILSSCSYNDAERNKLVFINSIDEVQDSIRVMNSMLDIFIDDKIINYYIVDENYLYVNSKPVGKVFLNGLIQIKDSLSVLSELNKLQIERLTKIALFLKRNFICGAYKNVFFERYFYDYRPTPEVEYKDLRVIFYGDENSKNLPCSPVERVNFLEHQKNLFLISFTDIRE